MPRMHDIAVLGLTPAGCAAAYWLARKGRDAVVVDCPRREAECPLADWVPRGFFRSAALPGSLARASRAKAFREVRYHNAELDKEVEYRSRTTAGYFLTHAGLVKALRTAATKAGARVRRMVPLREIRLEEDHIELLGARRVVARLLLVAYSRPSDVIGELSLPVRTVPRSSLLVAGLDVPLSASVGRQLSGPLHVVETAQRNEFGMFFAAGTTLHLRIVSDSAASGNRAAELSAMVSGLQRAAILPPDLPLGRARGAAWRPPAGVALELETHVAKRCLLAGTAGGFVESVTGQTLATSVKSALLAAEIARVALGRKNLQEALIRYKTSWRDSLADRLRPPNTALQMLLPLLFVNQRIVAKFTRALLYGEKI